MCRSSGKVSRKISSKMRKKRRRKSAAFDVSLNLKDRALASAGEGITISDPSLPDNPLIYVNRGFERLTGYSARSVLGRNCRFLQGPDTDPKTAQAIRYAIANERECTVEILNYRKDGRKFWNRLTITPVRDASGRTTNFIGVQSDVTKRREAEQALREANEKLESANLRMKTDLDAAARVQRDLLPEKMPAVKGFDFAWYFRPCDELAGDILNVFMLDSSRVGLYIIDVSGHGVSASLLSVTLSQMLLPLPGQSVLFTQAPGNPEKFTVAPPALVAERLNTQFQLDKRTGRFFTMIYGVLDTKTHMLDYVCAGHPAPVVLSARGKTESLVSEQFPVGIVEKPDYQQNSIRLKPRDRMFFYTDGAEEALNLRDCCFGSRRLLREIRTCRNRTVTASLKSIAKAIERWCSGASIRDDISLLAIEACAKGQKTAKR